MIPHELLVSGVLDSEIVIGTPGARVEIELMAFVRWLAIGIQRDDLVMVRVTIHDEASRVVKKSRFP